MFFLFLIWITVIHSEVFLPPLQVLQNAAAMPEEEIISAAATCEFQN